MSEPLAAVLGNQKSYAGAVKSPSPNRVTTPIPGNMTSILPSPGNTKPGMVANCSDAITRAQAQPIVKTLENVLELPLISEKMTVSTFEVSTTFLNS
ncbi:hypothetical protein ACFX2F_042054 [Malus domestica]